MQNPASTNTARRVLALSLLSAFAAVGAQAADLTWIGGAGNWNTSSANWNPGPVLWNNSNNDNAIFGGTGATVTLTENITANNVTFGVSGYTIAGSSTLAIGGTITNGSTATISAKIGGSNGLTKAGNGTLVLQGVNTYTGPTTVQAGLLQARTAGALPSGTTVTIGATSATASLDIRASQTIAGVAKGGTGTSTITQSQTTGTTTLTINPSGAGASAADSTFSGTITDAAGSGRILALTKAGSNTLTLTGVNSYAGATTISGGTLRLGSGLTASNGVTISGGTLSGNGIATPIALGTGAVSMSTGAIAPGGADFAGAFTLGSGQNFTTTGGTLNFDLLGASSFDQITGSGGGSFSLAGTTLALSGLTSVSGTYQLFSGFGGANSISGLTITGLGAGVTGSLDTTGLLTVTAIPEPSSAAALVGVLALSAGALRRRRRA